MMSYSYMTFNILEYDIAMCRGHKNIGQINQYKMKKNICKSHAIWEDSMTRNLRIAAKFWGNSAAIFDDITGQ